jgi:hypothetical protein
MSASGRLRLACSVVIWLNSLAAGRVLDEGMHHLRSGDAREWDEFPQRAEGRELVLKFASSPNAAEQALRLRQRDVKQVWRVRLNEKDLGTLVQDESAIVHYLAIPAQTLREGDNELRVSCDGGAGTASDDVSVGDVELVEKPRAEALAEATLAVEVTDADGGNRLPCRLTVVDRHGALISLGTPSGPTLAVRPGVVYTADGRADLRLPAGRYSVYAGRGFEYSIASKEVDVAGARAEKKLSIRRVVPTERYVSCDTHVHTLTCSRHGDATIEERMLTLAGEGIELPIATEHNLQVDYASAAEKMNVRRYFTPVIGNEVTTTALGHFNVFPIAAGSKLIDWQKRTWDAFARAFAEVPGEPVVVLNHARDVHGGFRPFDPVRHVSLTGEQLDSPAPPANAMEVINSGATLNDPMRLYRDWFGMLNAGHRLTPVGSSDSHDVARFIVGQGRTYVKCDDGDPDRIDVDAARRGLREGRVFVSYGLGARITVAGRFGPGDLVPAGGDLDVEVTVLGPEWVKATRVALYANGVEVRSADISTPASQPEPAGVKWRGRWTLPRFRHDVHLVAIATGPRITAPFWPTAKPYQPTSDHFNGYVIGSTGAVWVDADGSGGFDCARDYAKRIMEKAGADSAALAAALADYDDAVAAQAAGLLRQRSGDDFEPAVRRLLSDSAITPAARRGFEAYLSEWRQTVLARSAGKGAASR